MSEPPDELPEAVKRWMEANPPRYCGECVHFLHECIDGTGWCEVFNLGPRCDTAACLPFFEAIEPKAIQQGPPSDPT